MAPIVNGTAPSESIPIQNGINGRLYNEDIVKLESLPEDVKELCNASLKVNVSYHEVLNKWIILKDL